jgi:hypothetical protein
VPGHDHTAGTMPVGFDHKSMLLHPPLSLWATSGTLNPGMATSCILFSADGCLLPLRGNDRSWCSMCLLHQRGLSACALPRCQGHHRGLRVVSTSSIWRWRLGLGAAQFRYTPLSPGKFPGLMARVQGVLIAPTSGCS